MKSGKRQMNKDHKIYVGRYTNLHNLLSCAHTLCLNYVTATFLLVSSSGTNYDAVCGYIRIYLAVYSS